MPPAPIEPALGLLELESIAAGIEVADAMVKRAPVELLRAGTVHPGKYLVLVGGAVADVEEALDAGSELGGLSVRDVTFLPNIHPAVVEGVRGTRLSSQDEALGIIETATAPAIIRAADAGLKGAHVRLLEIHLADDLGGKGYLLFDGAVTDVQAAVEIGTAAVGEARGLHSRVIAQVHQEMAAELAADGRFGARVRV
jgi:bacterial microcompartment shell protein